MAVDPDELRAPLAGAPALAVAPPPEPDPAEEAEAAAWSAVVAAWDDEEAHRAYLERPLDLDGLALAGQRYRAVLAERPGDAIATRCRDEVVRRATVLGLTSLPRSAPPRRVPRWILIAIVGAGSAVLAGWAATTFFRLLTSPSGALP
jgi:hypothetical protein